MKIKEKILSDKTFNISIWVAMALMLGLGIFISTIKEFWYDEVAVFGYIRSDISIFDMFHYYATIEVTNLPLYTLIAYPFYHLLPASDFFVLLPSIIMSIAACVLMVKLADKIVGRVGGYITLFIVVLSRTMMAKVGTCLRAYSLMILGSVFFIYMLYELYGIKNKNSDVGDEGQTKNKSFIKTMLIACFAGLLLAFSHYFGVLFMAITGAIVIVLIIMKKMNIKMIIPFAFSGVIFTAWFVYAFATTDKDVSSFWIAPPTLISVADMFGYVLSGSIVLLAIWGMSVIYTIVKAIVTKNFFNIHVFNVAIVALITGVIFIYSAYINPGGGLFEGRYFFVIFPNMVLSIAYYLDGLIKLIGKLKDKKVIYYTLMTVLTIGFIGTACDLIDKNEGAVYYQYDRYNFFAEYIIKAGDIEKDDVILVLNSYDEVGKVTQEGWLDYYLIRQGYTPSRVVEVDDGDLDNIVEDYGEGIRRIYVFGDTDHFDYDGDDFEITDQFSYEKGTVMDRK